MSQTCSSISSVKITFKNLFDTEYTQELRNWRNQDFVRGNMTNHDIISEAEHNKYLDSLRHSKDNKIFVAFADKEPLAVITIKINTEENYIEPGMYIVNKNYLGKGYGIIMSYVRLEYIFAAMPEGRMRTVILDKNEKNINLQQKMGCKFAEHITVKDNNGNEEAASVFYLTKEDWDKNKSSIEERIKENFDLADIGRIPL